VLRKGVFHNREKLYARSEVREILLGQHRAIFEAVMARDPEAAGRAAEDHITYTRRVLNEIAAAEARLAISIRRIERRQHQLARSHEDGVEGRVNGPAATFTRMAARLAILCRSFHLSCPALEEKGRGEAARINFVTSQALDLERE
jgi:hypothetical protein